MSSSARRALAWLFAILAVFAAVTCLIRTRATCLEYYGEGPPYYGMTTNMDKWESPVGDLVLTNLIGLPLLLGAAWCAKHFWHGARATRGKR